MCKPLSLPADKPREIQMNLVTASHSNAEREVFSDSAIGPKKEEGRLFTDRKIDCQKLNWDPFLSSFCHSSRSDPDSGLFGRTGALKKI